jgi:multiple antibiotic resistance protein
MSQTVPGGPRAGPSRRSPLAGIAGTIGPQAAWSAYDSMNEFVGTFLLTFAALFPIVNPIANAPIFLALTQFNTEQERNALAWRIAVNSFFLLLGSLFMGSHVLEFFGVSLPILRIGGGLVVCAFGWKLLNTGIQPDSDPHTPGAPAHTPDSFYPLTMPLTVGPGSMSVAITLGSQRPMAGFSGLLVLGGAAIAGIAAICLTVFLSYRFAEQTVAKLGATGTNVFIRLSAFILFCIGLQIAWNGWLGLAAAPH